MSLQLLQPCKDRQKDYRPKLREINTVLDYLIEFIGKLPSMRTRARCQGLEYHDSCTSQIEIFWSLQRVPFCVLTVCYIDTNKARLCTSGSLRPKPAVGLGQRICLQGVLEARPALLRSCVCPVHPLCEPCCASGSCLPCCL